MADNWNGPTLSRSPGYILKGNNLIRGQKEQFEIVAHVHTHPSKTSDKGFSIRDWNIAISHPQIPYFIIHGDGNVYGGIFQHGVMKIWENNPIVSFSNIKNGTISLFDITKEMKK